MDLQGGPSRELDGTPGVDRSAVFNKDHVGLFACAPSFDGSRRCTRLFRVGEWNVGGVQYTKFKGATSSAKLEVPFPAVSASQSPANICPEGWEMAGEPAM